MASGSEGTGGSGPGSWDELLARLLRTPEGKRPLQRVDIGKLMSADARDLLIEAAQRAATPTRC
jgi:ATP-dependent Clp protease ATP-binding subunit ClpC